MEPNATLNNLDTSSGLDLAEAGRILARVGDETSFVERIARISEYFLGRPYVEGSLGGGPGLPEVLRVSLAAFDCVTHIEAVLALAIARTTDEFVDAIRRIRYQDGKVEWLHRNHYMVDWARNNEQVGLVANLTAGSLTIDKTCTLDLIAGLPAQTTSFRYFPSHHVDAVVERVETGDLIFFVSTRPTLDVFHTALLVKRKGNIFLRHATRTANAVIEQDLSDFIGNNQTAGFVLLRPLCLR